MLVLAEAAETAELHETAAQTLETYTKDNPRDTKALHWLGRAYTGMGKHDLAREVYERLIRLTRRTLRRRRASKTPPPSVRWPWWLGRKPPLPRRYQGQR